MTRAACVALVVVGVLAGCSGSEPPAAPASTVSVASTGPGATDRSTTAAPATAGAVSGAPGTGVPRNSTSSTSVAASNGTTLTTAGAPTVGEWCAVAIDLHGLTTAFRELDADNRGAVQMSLVAILERLAAIAPLTPPALAADLAVSTEAFALLDRALAEVAYDLDAADLTALEARTETIAAANQRIRDFNARECGIDVGVTGADAP